MFYYPSILQRHTGRFATIWLAATGGTKIVKREYLKVNVSRTCEEIIAYVLVRVQPLSPGGQRPRFSLYLSSQLGYGIVCVYHKQCDYLIDEIKFVLERLHRFHKQQRIDMVQQDQPGGLLLPDPLSMMEALEDAPDPFFGVMDVDPCLPSPRSIPQVRNLLETPSPERRRLDQTPPRPRVRKPATDREICLSPERITLREEEPLRMPEVEYERDLQEITAQELEFLMADEVPFPAEEEPPRPRERREVPRRRSVPSESAEKSVEKERVPEQEVTMPPVSPPSRVQEEPVPELDSVIILDEATGEPVAVPPIPELSTGAIPDLHTEVTPAEPRMPPPPVSLSPVTRAPSRSPRRPTHSPQLLLADIYELPGAAARRRRRQLRFIDRVTQIPGEEMKQMLEDVNVHCQPRPPIELPHKRRRTPADLLDNPAYVGWMPPVLRSLWSHCARMESVNYASLQAAEARQEEVEGSEEERGKQQEGVSELESVREGERTAPLMLSSEISLEVSEEEKSRAMLVTPEKRVTVEPEELALPIVFEQPEPIILEPELERDQITPEFVRRMLEPLFEQFGEIDFDTLAPSYFPRIIASKLFFSCLVLSSRQILILEQKEPFKRMVIKPGPRFHQQ